ncbi:MAG: nitrile hydratase subunit beta [Casimicrobiaceae bacterium]
MNGVHDMGGLQNFGPILPEQREPPFHHEWERRAFGLTLAMAGAGMWNLDQARAARESLPPARYLASSYYRIWLDALSKLMLERGLVTFEELADGRLREPPAGTRGVLTADRVASALARGSSTYRALVGSARYSVGDAVRTRVVHPQSHTRLPRYCRGKRGTVAKLHGAHVFADANARGNGEEAQWLYTVRFAASELWGPDTTAAAIHVDCWEPYLEGC